jgi:hypothetical protein
MAVLAQRNGPVENLVEADLWHTRSINSKEYQALTGQVVFAILLLDVLDMEDTPYTTEKLLFGAHPFFEPCFEEILLTLEVDIIERVDLWHLDVEKAARSKVSL